MKINPFYLERYFADHEFSAPYLLSASDAEPLSLQEVLALADEETRALWENLWLGYTESRGHPALLEEVATLYEGITAQEVLEIVPEEGIFIAMNTLLEPGDHVIATFPGYQSLYEIAEALGCQVSRWGPESEGKQFFDVERLKSMIRENTRLIVINFPHNPTGALLSSTQLAEIITLAQPCGIPVFSDEMYRLLEYDPVERLPAVCEIYENGVSLSGMSKTLALPGLRVGWLATQNGEYLQRLCEFKDYTTICGSAPSEVLALIALRARARIIGRNLEIIQSNLSLLDPFLARHADCFCWTHPRAGTVAFPRFLGRLPVKDFCEDLLAKKGILLLPADVFDFPQPHFRIGFGRRNLPAALSLLEEYLLENKAD